MPASKRRQVCTHERQLQVQPLGVVGHWVRGGLSEAEWLNALQASRWVLRVSSGCEHVTVSRCIYLNVPFGAKIITRTTFITVGELFPQLHTHISYTSLIVEELLCVMHAYLWRMFVLPLLNHRQAITQQYCLGNNVQLHAHQLHNNNCRGVTQ